MQTVVLVMIVAIAVAVVYGALSVSRMTPETAFWDTHPLFPQRRRSWRRWLGLGESSVAAAAAATAIEPPPDMDDLARFAETFLFPVENEEGDNGMNVAPARVWIPSSSPSSSPVVVRARAVVSASTRTPDPKALARYWLSTTPTGTTSVLLFQAHVEDVPPDIVPLIEGYRRTIVDVANTPAAVAARNIRVRTTATARNARLNALFGTEDGEGASFPFRLRLRTFTSGGGGRGGDVPVEWSAHWKRMMIGLSSSSSRGLACAVSSSASSASSASSTVIVRFVWYLARINDEQEDENESPTGGCEIALDPSSSSVVLTSVYFHAPAFPPRVDAEDTHRAKLELVRRSLREAVRIAGVQRVKHIVAVEWAPDMSFVFEHLFAGILRPDPRHHVVVLDADRSLSVYATNLRRGQGDVYLSPNVFL